MRDSTRLSSTRSAFLLAMLFSAWQVTAAPAQTLSPGEASGSFSLDGKTVSLHYAYAMIQPDTFDEKKTNTAMLLSEKPLPEKALAGVKDLERAGRGQTNWILVKLDEKDSPIREVVHHAALGEMSLQMSGMAYSSFQPVVQLADRIEGSLRTKGEVEFLDHKYQTDVRFNAVLREANRDEPLPDAKTGKKLSPGGGEPGKAFLAFQEAVKKKDLATIRKLKPADMPDASDDELRNMLDVMAAMTPSDLKIAEGYVKGDTAALYLTGTENGQKRYGTVRMDRIGGRWLSTYLNWSDKPPER